VNFLHTFHGRLPLLSLNGIVLLGNPETQQHAGKQTNKNKQATATAINCTFCRMNA